MNRDAIRERVSKNMQGHGLAIEDLRVQPDPFDGWRLWLVSEGFREIPRKERRALVLEGLEGEHFEWIDTITPDEKAWSGRAPLDSSLEDLPLWPEALGQARTLTGPIAGRFASDLDEDLEPPLICTFYSLKGGVGRTTALAYTALTLAAKGIKVVCVDMDLEAPGLTTVFGREHEIGRDMGAIHILDALDRDAPVDPLRHLIQVADGLELYLVPAGLPGANHARLLRFMDPLVWYRVEDNPLPRMVDLLRTLPLQPQVILVDARTGFDVLNAPFLFELSDLTVITFFPHPQARLGTGELVRALLASTSRREVGGHKLTPMPRFLVSPIPASKAPEVTKRYRHRALEWITEWLSVLDRRERLVEEELTHFVPYREAIATSDSIQKDEDAGTDYQPIAEWLLGFLKSPDEPELAGGSARHKLAVLDSLHFQGDTTERQERLLETFVETAIVNKALAPDIPLVLGRKGTGKTAVFRRLVEKPDRFAVVVLAPAALRGQRPWVLGADGFKQVGERLRQLNADWREVWSLCIAVALHAEAQAAGHGPPAPDPRLAAVAELSPHGELRFVDTIEAVLSKSGAGLLVADWLDRLDRAVPDPTLLLFDGLDTGFGNTDADRTRRRAAIEGLFSFLTDRSEQFQRIRLKIVLREDLWRSLRFENKSHLFGRSVSLRWNQQVDFLRVVLKQALRSEKLVRFLERKPGLYLKTPIDNWPTESVFRVWNALVGERMKGGKTAFSRSWVWNRLADGNDDRIPRYLIQLFEEAVSWERNESRTNPYDRSLIRPRGLIESLPRVSPRALSALEDEEFPELAALFERLRELKSSPVDAQDIENLSDDLVMLAREVGVLSIYEGTEDEVERYKVPDIYLAGLGMARKGQA